MRKDRERERERTEEKDYRRGVEKTQWMQQSKAQWGGQVRLWLQIYNIYI